MNGLCRTEKTAYPDEETATTALLEIRAASELHNRNRKTPVRVYECQFCGDFHLTSQPGGRRG